MRRGRAGLGAADGCGSVRDARRGPPMRPYEAELVIRVAREFEPEVFNGAFATVSQFRRCDAVALVRGR